MMARFTHLRWLGLGLVCIWGVGCAPNQNGDAARVITQTSAPQQLITRDAPDATNTLPPPPMATELLPTPLPLLTSARTPLPTLTASPAPTQLPTYTLTPSPTMAEPVMPTVAEATQFVGGAPTFTPLPTWTLPAPFDSDPSPAAGASGVGSVVVAPIGDCRYVPSSSGFGEIIYTQPDVNSRQQGTTTLADSYLLLDSRRGITQRDDAAVFFQIISMTTGESGWVLATAGGSLAGNCTA